MDAEKVSWHSEYCQNAKPAINVKDRRSWNAMYGPFAENYSEDEYNMAYEDCKEAFWDHYAPEVAERFGYGDVYSEGRSGGWLVVGEPPDFVSEHNTDDENKSLLNQWLEFQREILSEMDYCCNERVAEVLRETRFMKDSEAAERAEMEARDIITI